MERVQQAARDLVEQRREEVGVAPVDQQHVDGLAPQDLGALEATEAGADDDDASMRTHRGTYPLWQPVHLVSR